MKATLREADYGDEDPRGSALADLLEAEGRLHKTEVAWEEARSRVRQNVPGAESVAVQCRHSQQSALLVWREALERSIRAHRS